MTEWKNWPALAGGGDASVSGLTVGRAAYGKAHRAATDFRWLAATAGFDRDRPLARLLNMGGQELEGAECPQIRISDRSVLAVMSRPSRTVDKAGRRTPFERHLLECLVQPDVPAVIAAAALLNVVGSLDDQEWFETYTREPGSAEAHPQWADPEYCHRLGTSLPAALLQPGTADRLPVDVGALFGAGGVITRGIDDLKRATTLDDLAVLYGGVEQGIQPAVLRLQTSAPLTPPALAALLLPLTPRAFAMSGGIPTAVLPAEEAANWSALAVQSSVRAPSVAAPGPDALARGRRLAEALWHNDPGALASLSSMKFVMWGPTSSGKTIYLAQLFTQVRSASGWLVRPGNPAVMDEVEQLTRRMRGENLFPPPTTVGVGRDLSFRIVHDATRRSADVLIKDRAGAESETLTETSYQQFREADGLLLMFDHTRDAAQLLHEVQMSVMKLLTDRRANTRHVDDVKDPRPVAICLTKADLLIQTAQDLSRSRQEPDAFVREHLDPRVVEWIEQDHETSRFFPVSSVGLRLRLGVVEPVLFLDEELELRIGDLEAPINLIEPLAWLFEEVADHRVDLARGAPS